MTNISLSAGAMDVLTSKLLRVVPQNILTVSHLTKLPRATLGNYLDGAGGGVPSLRNPLISLLSNDFNGLAFSLSH